MKFVLNGCDISFVAEAPPDITLEQLLKQCDKIHPHWCACGICSLSRGGYPDDSQPDLIIDRDSIRKAKEDADCNLIE